MSPDSLERQLESLLAEPVAAISHRERDTFDQLAGTLRDDLVLWGAGRLGRMTLSGLRRIGVDPWAFCDSNAALWGTTIDGVPVMSPAAAAEEFGRQATFVITIWGPHDRDTMSDRARHLLDLGCTTVVPFAPLFWKHPEVFGPYYAFELPHRTAEEAEKIRQAFTLWADASSRAEFVAQVKWRMRGDFDALSAPVQHEIYFPDDLVALQRSEVFVDCGAYDGDTIRSLLERGAVTHGHVVAFEPDPATFRRLHDYVDTLPPHVRSQIVMHQAAVGATRSQVSFDSTGTEASVVGDGTTVVDCVPLDEVLGDQMPTYVKMDIEGAELDAIAGGGKVIRRALPVLAICAYHKFDHPWRIPAAIAELSDEFRFFLRPHHLQAWDLVCYAVPRQRLRERSLALGRS